MERHGLSIHVTGFSKGSRIFRPDIDPHTFIVLASLAGFGILLRQPDMTKELEFKHHLARLLYQLKPRLREHLARGFRSESDLNIPKVARSAPDDAYVLPPDLQLDGRTLSPKELIKLGRAKAKEKGIKKPNGADRIRLGILEVARHNPIDPRDLTEPDALELVRLALFDPGSIERIDPSMADTFIERLLPTLEQHLDDDTETFNRWFFETVSDLVHLVAKRKNPGGQQPREVMRRALLEIVFYSFQLVGHCIHLLMEDFRDGIPDLTEKERAFFEILFMKQPFLGGLPLILLHDRFDFLKEAIEELRDSPQDPRAIGVVLKMLQYYGAMTQKRREADRRYKARSGNRNKEGKCAQTVSLDSRDPDLPASSNFLFDEIAAYLRDERKVKCSCGTMTHWRAHVNEKASTTSVIVLDDMCGGCNQKEQVKIPRSEFQKAGEEVRSF